MNKLVRFILAAGIFLLIFNTLWGASVVSEYNEINGPYGTGKVSVNLLNNREQQGKNAFTLDEIKHLQEFYFKNADMAYASTDESSAVYEDNRTKANVCGVSDRYGMFHQIGMKTGSFITKGNSNEMVAVVDEELAIALFNNTNVVGMYIELYGHRFRIIGVTAAEGSAVRTLADNGYGSVYIPVEYMLEYNTNSRITAFETRTEYAGTTGRNISSMKEALASIGKDPSNYKLIDWNTQKILLEEKAWMIVFISGAGIIILLLKLFKKGVADIYGTVNSALEANYFREALKLKHVKLCLLILEAAAALVLAYAVWDAVKFSLYVPPEYIPDELIDMGFFHNLFESLAHARVQNAGYIPTFPEMKANALCMLQNWNMLITLFGGFPLYFLGLRLSELGQGNTVKHLLYCCGLIFFSILLSLLILRIFNMPIVVNTKGLLIVSAFVLLSVAGRRGIHYGGGFYKR